MLKHLNRIKKKAGLAFIFLALLTAVNCGKRKPPLPPVERVAQRLEISGYQRGNNIILKWKMPPRNASDGSVLNVGRVDIYRIAEPLNSSLSLSEDEFASRSTLIATKVITNSDFGGQELFFSDLLNFADQPARLRYAVRIVNSSGQKAAFSNFLIIEPTAKVADPPDRLKVEVTQESLQIQWQPPLKNVDGTTPANILGFNIYRTDLEQNSVRKLNNTPIPGIEFSDKNFEFEKRYSYYLRTVSLGTAGDPLESLDSKVVDILPKDTFAPRAPSSITVAASQNTISIFFANNPEKDVIGYRIYRSLDNKMPLSDWTLLTNPPLTTNTFQDTNVESGKTYHYYLKAIDKFGNVSFASDVVSETVP